MIDIYEKRRKASFTFMNLYEICINYKIKDPSAHSSCCCKKYFKNSIFENNSSYLSEHYDCIKLSKNHYDNICKNYGEIDWLLEQRVTYNKNDSFEIHNKFWAIGSNKDTLIHINFVPDLSEINIRECMLSCILEYNILNKAEYFNKSKQLSANNKSVVNLFLSFNCDKPYKFDLNYIKDFSNITNNIFSQAITKLYIREFYSLYKFKSWSDNKVKDSELVIQISSLVENFKSCNFYKSLPTFIHRVINKIDEQLDDDEDLSYVISDNNFEKLLNKYLTKELKLLYPVDLKLLESEKESLYIDEKNKDEEDPINDSYEILSSDDDTDLIEIASQF